VGPIHLGGVVALPHQSAHEPRLLHQRLDLVSRRLQQVAVGRERRCNALLGVVKVIEIVAGAFRIRFDVHRGASSQVAVGGPIDGEQLGDRGLKLG
jgi:hypothetical protein